MYAYLNIYMMHLFILYSIKQFCTAKAVLSKCFVTLKLFSASLCSKQQAPTFRTGPFKKGPVGGAREQTFL